MLARGGTVKFYITPSISSYFSEVNYPPAMLKEKWETPASRNEQLNSLNPAAVVTVFQGNCSHIFLN